MISLATGAVRPLQEHDGRRSRRPRAVFAAAAAVVVLAALAAVAVAVVDSGDSMTTYATDGPAPINPSVVGYGLARSDGAAPIEVLPLSGAVAEVGDMAVYRTADETATIVLFGPTPSPTSADGFTADFESVSIGGEDAQIGEPSGATNNLRIIKWGPETSRQTIASLGLSRDESIAIASGLIAGTTPESAIPQGFDLIYSGPDRNPFVEPSRSLIYLGSRLTDRYRFIPGAPSIEAYLWYLPDLSRSSAGEETPWPHYTDISRETIAGRQVVVLTDRAGLVTAYWNEAGGLAEVSTAPSSLIPVVEAATVADQESWDAVAATVTPLTQASVDPGD